MVLSSVLNTSGRPVLKITLKGLQPRTHNAQRTLQAMTKNLQLPTPTHNQEVIGPNFSWLRSQTFFISPLRPQNYDAAMVIPSAPLVGVVDDRVTRG